MRRKPIERCHGKFARLPDGELERRERVILECAALGYQFPEAAKNLDVSLTTVKATAKQLYPKLGADNITHAVAIAIRKGIIQ